MDPRLPDTPPTSDQPASPPPRRRRWVGSVIAPLRTGAGRSTRGPLLWPPGQRRVLPVPERGPPQAREQARLERQRVREPVQVQPGPRAPSSVRERRLPGVPGPPLPQSG